MRHREIVLFWLLAFASAAWAQAAKPQTPREALIEMIASPTPGTFDAHLLNETRAKLKQLKQSAQQQFALPLMMMNAQTQSNTNLKWNATGPVLVAFDTPKTGGRMEVRVDRDVIKGNHDEMELSFHAIKDGHEDSMAVTPHLQLQMKSEENVWKLSEVGFSLAVKLDGALIDGIQKQMETAATQMRTANATHGDATFSMSSSSSMSQSPAVFRAPSTSESKAMSAVKSIIAAENSFKSANPQVGYTCNMSDLGDAAPAQAQVTDTAFGGDVRGGYHYSLYGCRSNGFKVVAVPANVREHLRAFCSDESGMLRFAEDGHGSTCLSEHDLVK
ncbi:MAG TPA: hypothetical protein VKW78_00880 [Terriglobales bacterium]|nr:hypothetical protein [Terriglobales bacterium]